MARCGRPLRHGNFPSHMPRQDAHHIPTHFPKRLASAWPGNMSCVAGAPRKRRFNKIKGRCRGTCARLAHILQIDAPQVAQRFAQETTGRQLFHTRQAESPEQPQAAPQSAGPAPGSVTSPEAPLRPWSAGGLVKLPGNPPENRHSRNRRKARGKREKNNADCTVQRPKVAKDAMRRSCINVGLTNRYRSMRDLAERETPLHSPAAAHVSLPKPCPRA